MRKRITFWLLVLALPIGLGGPSARAGSYTFSLIPATGNVAGPPGSTVGWGYSITNQSATDWLVTTYLNSDPFLHGTANSIFDFPDLAPDTTVTESFDPLAPTGLFELTWDSTAPVGFANLGTFTLTAEWWDGDPLNGGNYIADALNATASYSATVSPAAVPEPSVAVLLGTGLATLILRRRHRAKAAGTSGHLGATPPVGQGPGVVA